MLSKCPVSIALSNGFKQVWKIFGRTLFQRKSLYLENGSHFKGQFLYKHKPQAITHSSSGTPLQKLRCPALTVCVLSQDSHVIVPDLDESTSLLAAFDGHGGKIFVLFIWWKSTGE